MPTFSEDNYIRSSKKISILFFLSSARRFFFFNLVAMESAVKDNILTSGEKGEWWHFMFFFHVGALNIQVISLQFHMYIDNLHVHVAYVFILFVCRIWLLFFVFVMSYMVPCLSYFLKNVYCDIHIPIDLYISSTSFVAITLPFSIVYVRVIKLL